MEMKTTTVYTLSKEEIEKACYSMFVQKMKDLGINTWFDVSDIELLGYDDDNGNLIELNAE